MGKLGLEKCPRAYSLRQKKKSSTCSKGKETSVSALEKQRLVALTGICSSPLSLPLTYMFLFSSLQLWLIRMSFTELWLLPNGLQRTALDLIWSVCLDLLARTWYYFWVCWHCPSQAPYWACLSPASAGCDTQLVRGKNRARSQSAWVLCSIHSDTLLPRISISLQNGKTSLNVILCVWEL